MTRMMGTEATFTVEIDGKKVSGISTNSVFYRSFLPPVETLDKRERARLSGYLQMADEVERAEALDFVSSAQRKILFEAAEAYGYRERVGFMLDKLTALTGHSRSLVSGVIICWAELQPRSKEDWRRIWTGE